MSNRYFQNIRSTGGCSSQKICILKVNQPESMQQDERVNILLTGGAGFIGSHILDALLEDSRVGTVRVLDNFSTGKRENIVHHQGHNRFELMEGDIRDYQTCRRAVAGMHLVCHQAALGSVPRSLKDPLLSHDVNVNGTLHILQSSVEEGIRRVVFAASSSTYGDSAVLPKVEDVIGKPLSPYAVTKYVNEIYAEVYARCYGLQFVGLRYFNVFGPRQDPDGPYAAVIPLFMRAAAENKPPVFHGDGSHSRDFTFVANAVEANLRSLFADENLKDGVSPVNQVYNVACGEQHSLRQLWENISQISGCRQEPIAGSPRLGDVKHSLANIDKICHLLGYVGGIKLQEGLQRAWKAFK